MDQDSGGQNKYQSFFQRNAVSVITIALLVVVVGLYFSLRNNNAEEVTEEDTEQEQTADNNDQGQVGGGESSQQPTSPTPAAGQTGNVTASGVLKVSDNLQKGNLMVEGASGKIYINTKRDFSNLVGTDVTLQAEGTLNSFVFLGLNKPGAAGAVAGTDTTAVGGAPDSDVTGITDNVSFTGMLMASDDAARGNYFISSGNTKVYLKTVRDYTSLLSSQVILTATGTINSFTGAKLVAKK